MSTIRDPGALFCWCDFCVNKGVKYYEDPCWDCCEKSNVTDVDEEPRYFERGEVEEDDDQ